MTKVKTSVRFYATKTGERKTSVIAKSKINEEITLVLSLYAKGKLSSRQEQDAQYVVTKSLAQVIKDNNFEGLVK